MSTPSYTQSARLYDALYHFKNYSDEHAKLRAFIQEFNSHANTLLDVACGTGKHLELLSQHYQVEGLDLNAELLESARQRCPHIPLHRGDMMEFELGHTFDVVTCLFSSIGFVKTVDGLERAVACMARHLNHGGLLLVEPWFSPETFWTRRIVANYANEPELKIVWMYTSETEGQISVLDSHFLVGTPGGITHFTERHELGLFTQHEYQEAFQKAHLETHYDVKGLMGRGMYIGVSRK